MTWQPSDRMIEIIAGRPADTYCYSTKGGTVILASKAHWNDDGRPHDLLAILPFPIEGSRVLVLRPTVNPDLVDRFRDALDDEDVIA